MQEIKTYRNQSEAVQGMKHMARLGWRVQTESAGAYRKAGILSWILWGPLNFLRKAKARNITVIYSK